MLDNPIAGKILIATLNSWRYLSGLCLLGMLFSFGLLMVNTGRIPVLSLSLLLAIMCHYFCWRLWLDCRLFQIFYQFSERSEVFDTAINTLWDNNSDNNRSLISRWIGARNLLRFAGVTLSIQWLMILLSITLSSI